MNWFGNSILVTPMARRVLDIFLSSTSEDLRDHRSTVSDALARLGQFVVRMETFGAKPNKPLAACREEVAQSDALIVVVGHRYGWIPSKADGGDGKRSITWWEVQWALDAKKPVYAFMIDPKVAWSGAREQDRLIASTTEQETLEVWRAVRGLHEFRTFLENRTTRALFGTPDHLALLAATSLFPWLLENAAPMRPSTPADLAVSPGIPPDAAPAARSRQLHEQMYWQEQVHVLSARELITPPAPLRVAIVAGRPRTEHPALSNVSITAVAMEGGAAANQADDYTTGLSALIAASGGGGFWGVAPGTELLAISVLDEELLTHQGTIANAIDRAILGGARVICLPLGATDRSEILADAIQDANEAGVTVVATAGNNGADTHVYPAALESVIAVGAVNRKSEPTPWTSFGPWVDVAAPGEDLSLPAGADGYAISNGTSWACAIVAGTVALLLQINPKLRPVEIKKLLIETAHPGRGGKAGINVVDAYLAAYRAGRPSVGPSSPSDLPPATAAPRRRKTPKR